MLKVLFGRPASGKTTMVLRQLKEIADRSERAVLVIPEQFSFESERAVLRTLGDQAAQNVAVISFTRLCDEVGREVGGMAGRTLSGADKVIFMSRALVAVGEELCLWGKYSRSVPFAKTVLDTVGEFKINAVSPEELKKAAETAESVSLRNKLHDLALIYETYDTLVGERFLDPADQLTKCYRQLESCRYFAGKEVFFDSFKGFTGQQYKIIERALAQAKHVTVSFTNDPALTKETNVFANIRKAADKICSAARRYGVEIAPPIFLDAPENQAPAIRAVERLIAGAELPEEEGEPAAVTVCEAKTAFEEAAFAARTVRRLMREKGYRCRDFVVIAREAEQYAEAVRFCFEQNQVPCFMDKRLPLSAFPLTAAAFCAAQFAQSGSSEQLLRFHKTGLGTLTTDEISELENYVYLWNISGKQWAETWTMNPAGFVQEEEEPDREALDRLNMLRQKATEELFRFAEHFSGSAAEMARALVTLFEETGAADTLAALSEQFEAENSEITGDALRQSYEKFMRLLDSIAVCFGQRTLTKREFADALTLSAANETVGVIPRMLDEVTFGAADRIRPSRPKIAFILGANRGVFPKTVSASGLLANAERRTLIGLGIEIPDTVLDAMIDEEYLVYGNLCCPSDKLYISYAKSTITGEALEPSAFVEAIRARLPHAETAEPLPALREGNLPETPAAAYSEYCRRMGSPETASLRKALEQTPEGEKIRFLEERLAGAEQWLSPETAKRLYGGEIVMSATRFDRFCACPFSYFCKFGLKTKKLQPADFDVLQRGTIVHYVLEKIINAYHKKIAALSEAELDALVDRFIAEYLDGVPGYRAAENPRSSFLVGGIARQLKEVVRQIAKEFAQSKFEPRSCEMKIGKGGELPALQFEFTGGKIKLIGSIDRVDTFDGYVRVVDYKTGKKTFKLPDTLFGLNLQMLLYLYAVTRAGGLPDEKAAGILYMPARRDLDDNGLAMNGLLRKEERLVSAMDQEKQGEFIPAYKLTKSGELSQYCNSFIEKEEFSEIFDYIEKLMKETGERIAGGDIRVKPVNGREHTACEYCDFRAVCGKAGEKAEQVPSMKNGEVFKKMREANGHGASSHE